MFETDMESLPVQLNDAHKLDKGDIESILESLRNIPDSETDEIKENLWNSLGKSVEVDWFSKEMILVNVVTIIAFHLFGKKLL